MHVSLGKQTMEGSINLHYSCCTLEAKSFIGRREHELNKPGLNTKQTVRFIQRIERYKLLHLCASDSYFCFVPNIKF